MLKIKYLAVAASLLAVSSAYAADAQINFTGEIQSNTCDITNAAGGNVNVILPNISASNFSTGTEKAGQTAFDIILENCTDNTPVAVRFVGTSNQIDTASGLFKNISTEQPALNVGVAVYDSTGTLIKAAGNSSAQVNITAGTATIPLTAYYQATAPGVTAGKVAATGGIELVYN